MSDIADRIAAARKEAEVLKEKIKAKKDALADTTRMLLHNCHVTIKFELLLPSWNRCQGST